MLMSKQKREAQQMKFLEILVILLENGFSIQESLAVMARNKQIAPQLLTGFGQSLQRGQSLAESFYQIGYSIAEKMQIQLAELHGDILVTLKTIAQNRRLVRKQKEELQKVGAYPLLLLVFVIGLLFGMRVCLLPSLIQSGMVDENHWSIAFLKYGPFIIVGTIVFGGVMFLITQAYLRHQSVIRRATFISKIPLIGKFYRLSQTSFFALEWGKAYQQGLETHQILTQMALLPENSLMEAMAQDLHADLSSGKELAEQLQRYPFLLPEFPVIIFQGEIKGHLGDELLLYSQLLVDRLVADAQRLIQWLQPLVFLLVAALIVAIYVAMFLPMYGNIGGILE